MFALTLFTLLGLLLSVNAQSITSTASITASVTITSTISSTVSSTGSLTVTPTVSVTSTLTGTNTQTWTSTSTWSKTGTTSNTASISPSSSQTPTPSITVPPPPAPLNLTNNCKGHAVTVCLTWNDPTGTYVSYAVFYKPVSSSIQFFEVDTTNPNAVINGLRANTQFEFFVVGFNGLGIRSQPSNLLTLTTGNQTPKQNPLFDISNIQCAQGVNANTSRVNIKCTWTPSPLTAFKIEVKCRCVSSVRETVRIRKDIFGAKAATASSIVFNINRDVATCNIYFKAFYRTPPGRLQPGARQHIQLVIGV